MQQGWGQLPFGVSNPQVPNRLELVYVMSMVPARRCRSGRVCGPTTFTLQLAAGRSGMPATPNWRPQASESSIYRPHLVHTEGWQHWGAVTLERSWGCSCS